MRLTNIRLHPFGHFTDASWDLAPSLVVVHGPNEKGKTTLRQAIFHALFTPTKLTKTKLGDTVGPWLPLPAGDYAQVTLTFEHDGGTWSLEKRWGAGPFSRISDGTTSIADPATVQTRVGEMLEHGEATFRHVLFTGQSELEQTLVAIKNNAADLRDIRDMLNATAGAAADVDEQRLRRLVEEQIEAAFSRWDDEHGKPERQHGQEKVGGNRWKKDVGSILHAWYDWQELVAEHAELLAIEGDIDRVTREVSEVEATIADAAAFVETYGVLRNGLNERDVLDERVPRLVAAEALLTTVFKKWPAAQAAIEEWERQKTERESHLEKLETELATAKKRNGNVAAKESFRRIDEARRDWQNADKNVGSLPSPGHARLDAVERLEKAIAAAENKLASRRMLWRIEAASPEAVVLERGSEPAETVNAGPEGATGTAEARIRVVVGGVTLTVESGGDDVASLFDSLAANRASLVRELEACGAVSAEDVRLMAQRYRDAAHAAEMKKKLLEGLLLGKTFEQWEAHVKVIEGLPETRALDVIERDIKEASEKVALGNVANKKHAEAIAGWIKEYGDHDALGERLLKERGDLKAAREKLADAPGLPPGFESSRALLSELERAQTRRLDGQQSLVAKKEELGGLAARLGDRRSEDVAEEAEASRRKFERARSRGRAYLRIREELDRIATRGDDDPLAVFSMKVADMFSRITGREATVAFDGPLPMAVDRGGVSLPPERLSQGASGALALALRLAMAEAYLDGGTGFIMLDDPLVNLDPDRMSQAAGIIRSFAERSQVIFFTCHDHHAAQLQGTGDGSYALPPNSGRRA